MDTKIDLIDALRNGVLRSPINKKFSMIVVNISDGIIRFVEGDNTEWTVEVSRVLPDTKKSTQANPILCEHANEVPPKWWCNCLEDCYCKDNTCNYLYNCYCKRDNITCTHKL